MGTGSGRRKGENLKRFVEQYDKWFPPKLKHGDHLVIVKDEASWPECECDTVVNEYGIPLYAIAEVRKLHGIALSPAHKKALDEMRACKGTH